jgi:hypothetical protein
VFENRVLRRIFGPKRDEETGGWRKLHNEGLHKKTTFEQGIITHVRAKALTTVLPIWCLHAILLSKVTPR